MSTRQTLAVFCALLVVIAALSIGVVAFAATALVLVGVLLFVPAPGRVDEELVHAPLLARITPRHRARASLVSALR